MCVCVCLSVCVLYMCVYVCARVCARVCGVLRCFQQSSSHITTADACCARVLSAANTDVPCSRHTTHVYHPVTLSYGGNEVKKCLAHLPFLISFRFDLVTNKPCTSILIIVAYRKKLLIRNIEESASIQFKGLFLKCSVCQKKILLFQREVVVNC